MKTISLFFLSTIFACSFVYVCAADQPISNDSDAIMDYLFDNSTSDTPFYDQKQTRSNNGCVLANASSFDIVDFLTNPTVGINAQNVLQHDLFLRTNPLNVRPLNTLPLPAHEHYFYKPCEKNFSLDLFFNNTPNKYFSPFSDRLCSYVDLEDPGLLDEIDIHFPDLDIPALLKLFAPIKMEERKLGGCFQGHVKIKGTTCGFFLPLYYLERNFFLSEEERNEIAGYPVFRDFFTGDIVDFFKEHLMGDAIGIGDLSFDAERCVLETECNKLFLKARVTIPTAAAFKRGVIGRDHSINTPQPNFSFTYLYQLGFGSKECQSQAATYVLDFGTAVLDHLTAMTANSSLGQRYLGLGLQANFYRDLTSYLFLTMGLYGDVLLGKKQYRVAKPTVDSQEFDRQWSDPALANENLIFLNKRFIDVMYPPTVYVPVQPGGQVGARVAINLDSDLVLIRAGYDYWARAREKLDCSCIPGYQCRPATSPSAIQGKAFVEVTLSKYCRCLSLHGSLAGDLTVNQHGIGHDYSIFLAGAVEF